MKWKIIIIIAIAIILTLIGYGIAYAPVEKLTLKKTQETIVTSTTFIFGGDVMLSRNVNTQMAKRNDYQWPFAEIEELFKAADIAVVNLESPFSISSDYTVKTGSFTFNADPKSVAGLNYAGIDVVSLANNHMLNMGDAGIETTKKVLADNNIKYTGLGDPAIISDFAFLGYTYYPDPHLPGLDIAKMQQDIAKLKDKKVIVLMHAGTEYTTKPNTEQIAFAHAAIDAGAMAVIGHHPHWPQTIETYKNQPIVYSLGNLVFDQMWSEETRQGIVVKMTWQDGWKDMEIIPIKSYDYSQPRIIIDQQEKDRILQRIKS